MHRTPYVGGILGAETKPVQPQNVDLGQYFTALQQSGDMGGILTPYVDFRGAGF